MSDTRFTAALLCAALLACSAAAQAADNPQPAAAQTAAVRKLQAADLLGYWADASQQDGRSVLHITARFANGSGKSLTAVSDSSHPQVRITATQNLIWHYDPDTAQLHETVTRSNTVRADGTSVADSHVAGAVETSEVEMYAADPALSQDQTALVLIDPASGSRSRYLKVDPQRLRKDFTEQLRPDSAAR